MSFSSVRRVRAALLPIALATVAISGNGAFGAPPATALNCASTNFSGTSVTSYGATFQTNAERNSFLTQYATDCGANKAAVNYNQPDGTNTPPKAGSGRCVDLVTNHTPPTVTTAPADPNYGSPYTYPWASYCGSDDPLTSAQYASANSTGHGINQIPVAIGADAVIFNSGSATCSSGLTLTGAQVSGIFAGTITNFSALGCTGSQAITRVVRNAVSGTTCILKSYLQKYDPVTWGPSNATDGCGSTVWPNDSGATATSKQNGNGGIVSTVSTTAGTIGYTDLATDVNTSGGLINPVAQVVNRLGTAAVPYLGSSTAVGAANCTGTAPLPPHTASPGWDAVTISDGPTGYSICGFTYAFIFANCTAELSVGHPTTAAAECKVAVDVLSSAVSNAGQAQLGPDHYAAIPVHAQSEAQAGLQTVI